MINVSDLMDDPDFCDHYVIYRTPGVWKNGRFFPYESEAIKRFRPVQPASVRELEQFPEGDRHKGILKFFAKRPETFYITQDDPDSDNGFLADEIEYLGRRYKVFQVMPWDSNGFQRAFAYLIDNKEG